MNTVPICKMLCGIAANLAVEKNLAFYVEFDSQKFSVWFTSPQVEVRMGDLPTPKGTYGSRRTLCCSIRWPERPVGDDWFAEVMTEWRTAWQKL